MLEFIRTIGGQVNATCGLHITIGISSVIGAQDTAAVAQFVKKIGHVANQNAWAIYSQTLGGRHLNNYSHRLAPECATHLSTIASAAISTTAPQALRRMWRILGWSDATECQHVALGLFGMLHAEFATFRKAALTLAELFEANYPAANL